MSRYLLEVGVEEVPARLLTNALDQLESNAIKYLKEERVEYKSIEKYSTPRRLTLIIDGLDERQEDLKEIVKGPSKKIAFGEDNTPSKALEGFMRGQGVTVEDIVIEEFNGEEYVYANILKKGEDIKDILPRIVPDMIKNINFPKTMKWGGRNFKFIRPIRWIMSILDNEVVEFEFEDISVSNVTRGHRFLGSSNIIIDDIDSYGEKLRENYVIIDREERKDIIIIESEKLVKERGGNLDNDEDLIDEITNIVEYPTPLIGQIKMEYLELPKEVIITPMKEHQRYLPVLDDKHRLMPYFITVRNGDKNHIETVAKGNERVLGARLEDAKFFYEEDLKHPLEDYAKKLDKVTFHEKLGSMEEKVERLKELGDSLSTTLELGEETLNNVTRAAQLAKADLVTAMVGEFSELQGVMGKEYARAAGENEIVSLAIEEHYLPRYAGDKLPTTTAGLVLSIADKIDTICGLFILDIKPTGSQDPFALRRQSLAIINMILDKRLNLSLSELIETSLYIYVDKKGLAFDSNKVTNELKIFFNARIKNLFKDLGIRYDVIDAVVGDKIDNISEMKIRSEKITKWLETEDVTSTLEAFNRVANLAEKAEIREINEELFTDIEKELYTRYEVIKSLVEKLINDDKYDEALDELSNLENPINNFFENIMVMVDEEEIKTNRLALLKNIDDLSMEICDLSKIVL